MLVLLRKVQVDVVDAIEAWAHHAAKYGKSAAIAPGLSDYELADITHIQCEELRRIIKQARLGPFSYVYDFGCGAGRLSVPLLQLVDSPVIAYDPCQAMIALAPQNDRIRYTTHAAGTPAELVLVWCVLGGVEDGLLAGVCDHIASLVARGGALILADHPPPQPKNRLWQFRSWHIYLDRFEARGIRIEQVGSCPQAEHDVDIYLGVRPMHDRSTQYWRPEPIWQGQTVYLLGGGPSLRDVDVERLRGKHVMAINESAKVAPFADALFFTDQTWFDANLDLVKKWPGLVLTVSSAAKAALPDKVKRIEVEAKAPLGAHATRLRWGRSSGQSAVAVAMMMGATRIILLGYDMRVIEGRSHFHDAYREKSDDMYSRQFVPAFDGWGADARAAGVVIINATPGSALKEFPMADLDEVISDA